MFDVYFQYFDGNDCLCKDITDIEVHTGNGISKISGDTIMRSNIRIYKEIYLFSEKSSYTVSCTNIKCIEVRKK